MERICEVQKESVGEKRRHTWKVVGLWREHDSMSCPHPLLDVDHLSLLDGLFLGIRNDFLVSAGLVSPFEVGSEVL